MDDKDKARILDLLMEIASKQKEQDSGLNAELFKAHIAIENGKSVTCGYGTDLDMNKADDWLKDWFDETVNLTKDILAKQTSKLTHLLVDHYGGEYNSVNLGATPTSEIFARRQRENE